MRLPRSDWVLIASAALLLTLAYPPFTLGVPSFICLVPAALLILRGGSDSNAWRRHLHQGFWYGALTHGVLLYWLALALWGYGRVTVLLYLLPLAVFGGSTAIMFAIVGSIARRAPGRILIALPAGVVCLEWLAAQAGPIGFPWHQLGLTLTAYPVLLQTADIAGSAGLAFIVATINTLLAMTWWTRHHRKVAVAHAEVAFTLLALVALYGLHRLNTLPLDIGATVAVVQPNVRVDEKWGPQGQDAIVERTLALTELAVTEVQPELIAWPETALPDALQLHPRWISRLTQLTRRSNSTVIAGAIDLESSLAQPQRRYNAAFAFQPTDERPPKPVHRKRRLIPMVEWAPTSALDLSRTGAGRFTPGRPAVAVETGIGRYGVLLCYELTFQDSARSLRSAGASVLVTLSNDAWLGRTSAPHQHFAHAALRAVENRVTVVRAANTGISGIVDPLGRVVIKTEPFVETYAAGQILRSSTVPLAVQIGGMIGPAALGLLIGLLVMGLAIPTPSSAPRGREGHGLALRHFRG